MASQYSFYAQYSKC